MSKPLALPMSADSAIYQDEEQPLHAALRARGVAFSTPIWDDPAVDWRAFDAVLIRTTWDYVEKVQAFERWIDVVDAQTRLFNPAPVVRWNMRKGYLRGLEALGVPTIPTVWLGPGDADRLREGLGTLGCARAFLKPDVGATSSGTLRFDTDERGIAAARRHLDGLLADGEALLQPYLSSVETEGELSLMYFDGAFSHAFRKVPVAGDYRVQREHAATDHAVDVGPSEWALGAQVMGVIHLLFGNTPLYARVDLLRDAQGELRLTELEMVEPSLFLHHGRGAADLLVDALLARLR